MLYEVITILSAAGSNATNFGKREEALQLDLKAVELDPLNYYYYYNLAIDYRLLKDYGNAEKSLQTYLLHYPNAQSPHSLMAMVYLGQGKKDEALKEVEKESYNFV